MSNEDWYDALFWIVLVFTIISLYCELTIVCSYIYGCRRRNITRTPTKDYVWFMSIINVIIYLKVFDQALQYITKGFWIQKLPDGWCYFLGLLDQFLWSLSTGISTAIALGLLLPTINNPQGIAELQNKRCVHIIIVGIVVFIQCLIPMFGNSYGIANAGTDDDDLDKFQCWIKDDAELMYLVFYVPITVYMALCLAVFLYYGYQYFCANIDDQVKNTSKPMIWYTLIFVIQWVPRIILRFLIAAGHLKLGMGLVFFFWLGYMIQGPGNLFIWVTFFHDNSNRNRIQSESLINNTRDTELGSDATAPTNQTNQTNQINQT